MNNKRFFWDSNLAVWIEDKLYQFSNWYTDKRYPVENWSTSEPSGMPPVVDREYTDSLSFHTEMHEYVVADSQTGHVVAIPKTKKPRKKKAKKVS